MDADAARGMGRTRAQAIHASGGSNRRPCHRLGSVSAAARYGRAGPRLQRLNRARRGRERLLRRARRGLARDGNLHRRRAPAPRAADRALRVSRLPLLPQSARGGVHPRPRRHVLPHAQGRPHVPPAGDRGGRQVDVPVHARPQHRRFDVRERRHHRLPVQDVRRRAGTFGANAWATHGAYRRPLAHAPHGQRFKVRPGQDAQGAARGVVLRAVALLRGGRGGALRTRAPSPQENDAARQPEAPRAPRESWALPGPVPRGPKHGNRHVRERSDRGLPPQDVRRLNNRHLADL
mmetsp:Transcript_5627/g.19278  ORF Transcript_5627/g.19278 Transcript_5627/m.19278 type:complete len:292 (+) Transcript_5627:372-1247(+)